VISIRRRFFITLSFSIWLCHLHSSYNSDDERLLPHKPTRAASTSTAPHTLVSSPSLSNEETAKERLKTHEAVCSGVFWEQVTMQKIRHQTIAFRDFTLDLTRGCLRRGAEEVRLRPKSFDVLKYLVQNNGRLVSKGELLTAIWPDTAVTDDSLVQCLIEVRRGLGDNDQQIIRTIPRRGYIFEALTDESDRSVVITEEVESLSVTVQEDEEIGEPPFTVVQPALPRTTSLVQGINLRRIAIIAFLVAVVLIGVFITYRLSARNSVAPIRSIAVLPFVSTNGDSELEYLGDGLTDGIIGNLSQLPQLRVMSRNSVFHYKGKEVDPKAIGRELGVQAVLLSRLEQHGDTISIRVDLVNTGDNSEIWGDSYTRKVSDILQMQEDIARILSEKMRLHLTGAEQTLLARRYTQNSAAYDAYLKGHYWWNKRYEKALRKAIEYYNEAVALDPNFALAYAGLADCYALLGPLGAPFTNDDYFKAKAAAAKALELDNQLPEAHASRANIAFLYEWDWAAAEKDFKRALELNPQYSTAHQWYGVFLSSMGRHEEAIAEGKKAVEIDPLSISVIIDLARCFYHARRYDETINQYQRIFEVEPNHYRLNSWLEMAYEQKKQYDQAFEVCIKARSQLENNPDVITSLKKAYADGGWQAYWRMELELTEDRIKRQDRLRRHPLHDG
jgi:TolB-like protein/DNA-binding winged helix-turn-helix (wHTH) protein/Tfp pilus assembly protein PilF